MAKIEVLTELLVDELTEFKQDLKKLENLSKELKGVELNPDFSELKSIRKDLYDEQTLLLQKQVKQLKIFKENLNFKNTYSKWLIGLLASVLLIFICFTAYAFSSVKTTKEEVETLRKEKEQIVNHFSSFINSKKLINEAYSKWKNKK